MEKRLEKLRKLLSEKQVDGMLITNASNRRYISGFTGTAGYILVTQENAIFITDFRYIEQAKKQAPHFEIVQHQGPILDTVKEQLEKIGVKTLGFEQDEVTYALYKNFEKTFDTKLVPLSRFVESLRIVKDEVEIKSIKQAVHIADQAFTYILDIIKPGIRENEVALKLEYKMRELGAEGTSFDTIIASGYRSALPHGIASDKVIEAGELVTIDFGCIYEGYVSDMTRTVMVGKPNEKQREIYQIVLEAQLNGVKHVKAGMTGKEADALTRDIITRYGYGEYFGHGTGHGIGLDIHEEPRLSLLSEVVLQPGMMVTVEPGIYLPNFGGVRIEDDVIITETGREILNQSPKELIIIE